MYNPTSDSENPVESSAGHDVAATWAPLRMLHRLQHHHDLARRSCDVLEVTCSQSRLASELGISHGTLQKYICALGPAVLHRRPLRFDLTRAAQLPPQQATRHPQSGTVTSPEDPSAAAPLLVATAAFWKSIGTLGAGAAQAIEAVRQLNDDNLEDLLGTFEDTLAHLTSQLAALRRQRGDGAEGRSDELAPLAPRTRADSRPTRAPSTPQEGGSNADKETSSLLSAPLQLAPRALSQGATRRECGERGRKRLPDVLAALKPLTDYCRRTQSGFDGISNVDGLLDALHGYTLDQITHAAHKIVAVAKTTPTIHNPIAILCKRALQHDPVCFPATPPPAQTPRRKPVPPEHDVNGADPPELQSAMARVRAWAGDPDRAPDLARLEQALPQAFVAGISRLSEERRHTLKERQLATLLSEGTNATADAVSPPCLADPIRFPNKAVLTAVSR